MGKGGHDLRAKAAGRVPDGDRAAVDVDPDAPMVVFIVDVRFMRFRRPSS
jgi:hypothetical protein